MIAGYRVDVGTGVGEETVGTWDGVGEFRARGVLVGLGTGVCETLPPPPAGRCVGLGLGTGVGAPWLA